MGSAKNSKITLRILKFITLVVIACCFVYCNTSDHKIASSFLKRKYTRGHFSDKVPKVNTNHISYSNDTTHLGLKPLLEEALSTIVLANSNQSVDKPLSVPLVFSRLLKHRRTATENNGNVSYKSISEAPASLPGHPEVKHEENGFARAKPFLIGFLICVALGLVLIAIAAWDPGVNTGYFPTGGCFLLLLAVVCGIAALIFLILFLCALAPPVS